MSTHPHSVPPTAQGASDTTTPAATSGSEDRTTKRSRTDRGETAARRETEQAREHTSDIAEDDSVMNPRIVRSLPKRPLPKGTNDTKGYPWPDPLLPPTHTDEDPHVRVSRAGDHPTEIPRTRMAYTDAVYERQFVPFEKLLAGLSVELAAQIRADPHSFLAILPYGSGGQLYKEKPRLHHDVVAFLRTFRYEDAEMSAETAVQPLLDEAEVMTKDELEKALRDRDANNPDTKGLRVIMPERPKNTNPRDRYAKPWALFLVGGSARLREFLLWQHTFAVSKEMCFSVLKLEPARLSWVIANLKGDSVLHENKDELMCFLKETLWHHDGYRDKVLKLMGKTVAPGSVNDYVVRVTNTFTLTFFDNTDESGHTATIAQLRGKPLTFHEAEHREYLRLIRAIRLWFDMATVSLAGKINCAMCKSDTHPSYDCPFQKTKGWSGPIYNGKERHEAKTAKAMATKASGSQAKGREKGGTSRTTKFSGMRFAKKP